MALILRIEPPNMFPSSFAVPVLLFLTFLFILFTAISHPKQQKDHRKQPPGPPSLPIIGNLHMLGKLPHRSLQSLAKIYGPIMFLRLGQVPTIVVSSPEAAELFLKTHDTVFATRPIIQAADPNSEGVKGLVFSEYGPYWRHVRKLCTIQLLSASKVETFAPLRREELGLVVKLLKKAAAAREVVDLSQVVGELIENIMYRMILGRAKDDRFDLKGLINEAFGLAGAFNLADYVPWLGVLDLQGLTKSLKKYNKAVNEVVEKIVTEHEQATNPQNGPHHKDFIDILLSLMHKPIDPNDEQNHVINRGHLRAIALDMISGASETSAVVIEWALSELLRHPRVMKKLKNELEDAVGMNRMVEEADLAKLIYMDMVIKETLRLYPVGPLLVPRESREDIMINGYYIKKKTRILVNVWSIGRDPKVWSDNAEVFYPERFAHSNIDLRGHDFQLIPFGSGRRGCPGMQLGLTTVKFVLAQLVHCFDWELPVGMAPAQLDMNEKFGLSMPRAKHLFAVPNYCLFSKA